jgi:hypothetical protein
VLNKEFSGGDIWGCEFIFAIDDLDRLYSERYLAVLRERPDECVEADIGFWPVKGCNLDEDILCVD